jgi:predicted ATP-grasp superfamily ATP-dependent carboligase
MGPFRIEGNSCLIERTLGEMSTNQVRPATIRPVLLLGMEPRITVPVARSLHRLGAAVAVAGLSSHDIKPYSRDVFEFVRTPNYEESPSEFISLLTAFIKKHGFDMLIPTTDGALNAIARHYDRLAPLLHLACPSPEQIDRVLNKESTLTVAKRCGIRIPQEYLVLRSTRIDDIRGFTFPVVAKPRQKSFVEMFKVRYLHSEQELRHALDSGLLDGAILQEYCPGQGVGVEVFLYKGTCVAAFQHRRLKEVPHTGGAASTAVSEVVDPELKKMALDLLYAFNWQGVAMVEFRHDPLTGKASLMEVNGRYWGTVALPILAGLDFPAYEWQCIHGQTPIVPDSYAIGMQWRWTAGSLKRWHGMVTNSRSFPSVAEAPLTGSDRSVRRDALWSSRDPMPAVFEVLRTAKNLVVQDTKSILKKILPMQRARELFK